MAEDRVNGPEDSIVTEMIKQLPQEKLYDIARCCQDRFMGLEAAHQLLQDRHIGVPRKPDDEPEKWIRNHRAIAFTVTSMWYATCSIPRLEREKEPEGWMYLHVVGV